MDPLAKYNLESWEQYLAYSAEVSKAVTALQPVVAFETTVLSFGLPYPINMETAARCETIAREGGATPATVGMIDGQIHIGLTHEAIELFCKAQGIVTKVNLQNMASALLSKNLGAYTVAASTQVCSMAGINVFATGGIGGVHRDYTKYHDISSDLLALARYPVAVVCAGVKSILDVPATLEHLETLGVPVIGYKTKCLPLFHSRHSHIPVDVCTDSIAQVAHLTQTHWNLGGRGVLVVTPVPQEHAIETEELEEWITAALRAAQVGRVSGKAVTPFLLKRLEELSGGRSITTNVALLENNAKAATALAGELATLRL